LSSWFLRANVTLPRWILAGVVAIVVEASPVWAVPGLDARPANPTCVAPPEPLYPSRFVAQRFCEAIELADPIDMVQPPDNGSIWYIAERNGRILEIDNDPDAVDAALVLDLRDTSSE
jgi:hypothetical protein